MHFYAFFNHFYGSIFEIALLSTVLSFPYNHMSESLRIWILSVRSLLFALFLIERHRSQNQGSLKSEEGLSHFKEQCAQLWFNVND